MFSSFSTKTYVVGTHSRNKKNVCLDSVISSYFTLGALLSRVVLPFLPDRSKQMPMQIVYILMSGSTLFATLFLILGWTRFLHQWACPNLRKGESPSVIQRWKGEVIFILKCLSECWCNRAFPFVILFETLEIINQTVCWKGVMRSLTILSLSFWSGPFRLCIWTCLVMKIGFQSSPEQILCKQCRSLWDGSLWAVSSGSKLFARVHVSVWVY